MYGGIWKMRFVGIKFGLRRRRDINEFIIVIIFIIMSSYFDCLFLVFLVVFLGMFLLIYWFWKMLSSLLM